MRGGAGPRLPAAACARRAGVSGPPSAARHAAGAGAGRVTMAAGAGASVFALTALRRSAAALAAKSPRPRGRLLWRELGNKLEVFEIFRYAEAQARAAGRDVPLAALVERALDSLPYRGVWTLEGLGYGLAQGRAAGLAEPRGG